MDIEAVKLIKQKLLEGWIVTCCVKDCVEPLKQFTTESLAFQGGDVEKHL